MSWSRTRVLLPLLAALSTGACGPNEATSELVHEVPVQSGPAQDRPVPVETARDIPLLVEVPATQTLPQAPSGEPAAIITAATACAGNNFADANYQDTVSTGGPMLAIEWVLTSSVTINLCAVCGKCGGVKSLESADEAALIAEPTELLSDEGRITIVQ